MRVSKLTAFRVALIVVGLLAVLVGVARGATAPALLIGDAEKVSNHVRLLEKRNHFGLRARIGPFTVSRRAWCERIYGVDTVQTMTCHYTATGTTVDENNQRPQCDIRVKVRRRAHRKVWKRTVEVCANQYAP